MSNFSKGGLNIGSLKSLNWGLLGKWWRRFKVEKKFFLGPNYKKHIRGGGFGKK